MTSSFIRVVETWLPASDGTLLEFGTGLYPTTPGFGAISRSMCFGRGEGLPGRVWDAGRPILLPQLDNRNFLRTAAAHDNGLHCAVGIPCFVQDRLAAVVVLLCGDTSGVLELWHHDPRINSDMTLIDGCFGGRDTLEAVSRDTFLPRGVGLPGLAWQRNEAVFLSDLTASTGRFLRADEALLAGLREGLAVPCETTDSEACVLTVLASAAVPVARGIERWAADTAGGTEPQCLFRHWVADTTAASAEALIPAVQETLGSGLPTLVPSASPQTGAFAALPLTSAGRVSEVLILAL